MMKKSVLLTALLVLLIHTLYGQEKQQMFLYLETGMDFISCAPPDDKEYIRNDVNPNPYMYESTYNMSLLYKGYAGVKGEIKLHQDLFGLLGGIRYTRMEGSLGRDDYWSSGADFLYLLYQQQGTTTEYLKVKDITQVSHYLGMPLELRIYPYEHKTIQVYYKLGVDVNVLLASQTRIGFFDPDMDQYEEAAGNIVEDPWPVYSSVHLAVGLKIGKVTKPGVNIEVCAPSFIIADFNSSLVTPIAGGGFQLNVRIPL